MRRPGQGDVWQIKKPAKNDLHPTMKPVALVERADLTDGTFIDAYFYGARMQGAILSNADLSGADLRRTVLTKANLHRANLQGALLDSARLDNAQLVEAAESCQVSIIHPGKPRNPKKSTTAHKSKTSAPNAKGGHARSPPESLPGGAHRAADTRAAGPAAGAADQRRRVRARPRT